MADSGTSVISPSALGAGLIAVLLAGCHQAPETPVLEAARTSMAAGRPAEAAELLKPYIAQNVDDGTARAVLAEALLDMGNFTEAQLQVTEADRLRAPRSLLRVSECRIAAQSQTLDDAIQRCSAVMAETPQEQAALHLHAGHAQRDAGHPLAAAAEFETALELIPQWEPAERGRALALALAGEERAADLAIDALIAKSTDKAGAWHLKGEIEFIRGRYPAAARAFDSAMQQAARSGQTALRQQAGEHLVQSQLMAQNAAEALERVKSLQTEFPRALVPAFLRAQALGAQGQLADARVTLEDLLRDEPDQVQSKLLLGIVLLGLGQPGQAEMFLHNVQLVIPGNGLMQAAVDAMARNPGQPAKAFEQVRPLVFGARQDARWLAWGGLLRSRAALVADEMKPDPLRTEVARRLRSGGKDAARTFLEAEIARHPTPANLSMYAEFVQRIQPENAVSAMKRALEMEPENVEALITYGNVLLQTGHPQEAVPFLERAAKLSPSNPRLHYWLALAYSSTSNRAGARDALGEALRGGQLFDERRAAEALAAQMGVR